MIPSPGSLLQLKRELIAFTPRDVSLRTFCPPPNYNECILVRYNELVIIVDVCEQPPHRAGHGDLNVAIITYGDLNVAIITSDHSMLFLSCPYNWFDINAELVHESV